MHLASLLRCGLAIPFSTHTIEFSVLCPSINRDVWVTVLALVTASLPNGREPSRKTASAREELSD